MKYKILKAIDVAGLAFLDPVVRLAYGEEPRVQVREIGRLIVVPLLAFAVFLLLWSELAPRHRTKSGEVPTPSVVVEAAQKVWAFHEREAIKERGYAAVGQDREKALADAEARLLELEPLVEDANARVAAVEAAEREALADTMEPLVAIYEQRRDGLRAAEAERKEAWVARADALPASAMDAKRALLDEWMAHVESTNAERDELDALKAEMNTRRSVASPALTAALREQTALAEERQFLEKHVEMLTRNNRDVKSTTARDQIAALETEYLAATGGAKLQALASNIVRSRGRLAKVEASTYAKPYTLPMQTLRSLLCVFVGFFIGTAVAIPVGVLCGLSPTAMAAMTPFIALLKPVSPIVWLPIALIVVGGFVPDPDKHWLMVALADLPVVGWMKINPAFLASAVTVALCSLWATLVNTALGVASIDKDHLNVARMLQLGFRARLFKIVLPSALPLIFAGLRISLGVGWMVLIAAELLSSSEGIGKYVWDMFNNGASESFAQMFVVVFVVGFIGLALDRTMIVFQRLVTFDGAPTSI